MNSDIIIVISFGIVVATLMMSIHNWKKIDEYSRSLRQKHKIIKLDQLNIVYAVVCVMALICGLFIAS